MLQLPLTPKRSLPFFRALDFDVLGSARRGSDLVTIHFALRRSPEWRGSERFVQAMGVPTKPQPYLMTLYVHEFVISPQKAPERALRRP